MVPYWRMEKATSLDRIRVQAMNADGSLLWQGEEAKRRPLNAEYAPHQMVKNPEGTDIPAFIIHCTDALAMRWAVKFAKDLGIWVIAIHDSMGCSPCDMEDVQNCYRRGWEEAVRVSPLTQFGFDVRSAPQPLRPEAEILRSE